MAPAPSSREGGGNRPTRLEAPTPPHYRGGGKQLPLLLDGITKSKEGEKKAKRKSLGKLNMQIEGERVQ